MLNFGMLDEHIEDALDSLLSAVRGAGNLPRPGGNGGNPG